MAELTSNSPPHNQRNRVLRNSTNQASNLKHSNTNQKRRLQRKKLIRFPPRTLKRAHRQEKRTAIPAYILQAVEVVGDARDGGGYDCHVQRDEEDGEDEGEDDGGEFPCFGEVGGGDAVEGFESVEVWGVCRFIGFLSGEGGDSGGVGGGVGVCDG